jgi:hypothetical protein
VTLPAIVCSRRCETALRWDMRELQAILDGRRSAASMSQSLQAWLEERPGYEDDGCAE